MSFFGQLAFGVGINPSPMDKGISEVKAKLAQLENAARDLGDIGAEKGGGGGIIAGLMGSRSGRLVMAGGAVTALGYAGVKAAGGLADLATGYEATAASARRAEVIFGANAGVITGFADSMATRFGLMRSEVQDAAVSFGAAFKSAGATTAEAAKTGTELAEIGLNLAAFNATNPEEVFGAMSAALRGEFDPLERFNIALNAAKVEAKAVEMGLVAAGEEMSDMAKRTATLALITEGSKDSMGALEAGSGKLGSQMARTGAILKEFKDWVGGLVAGPMSWLLDKFNDVAAAAAGWLRPAGAAAAATDAAARARADAMEQEQARAAEAAKAKAKAERDAADEAAQASKELEQRTASTIEGLQDELGAQLLGGRDAWDLYRLAVDGASASQVQLTADLMRTRANLEAQAASAEKSAERVKALAAWEREHRGITTAAAGGSQEAAQALARFAAGPAAAVPQEDPIQAEQLKTLKSIDTALARANEWNQSQGQPRVAMLSR
jgi:hypothetical protein